MIYEVKSKYKSHLSVEVTFAFVGNVLYREMIIRCVLKPSGVTIFKR